MLSFWSDMNDTRRLLDSFERQMQNVVGRSSRVPDTGMFRIVDQGEELVLSTELPGISQNDVEITLEGDVLTLRAERHLNAPKGFKLIRSERGKVQVLRQFELPCRVDAEHVEASLRDGVLTVRLPKSAEAKPRRIAVNGATSSSPQLEKHETTNAAS